MAFIYFSLKLLHLNLRQRCKLSIKLIDAFTIEFELLVPLFNIGVSHTLLFSLTLCVPAL